MDPGLTERAGSYQHQPGGYEAFIPKRLPPDPPLDVDDDMWRLLSQADLALGRLDGLTEILPSPDLFVSMYVRKEAVLSSQIEGTQASMMDVVEFEAGALRPGRPSDVIEVVNYVAAMKHGLEQLGKIPLCLRLIRQMHEKLLAGVRGHERNPGEFRKVQNWVAPPGVPLREASYVPPPVPQMHQALGALESFFHSPTPMPVLFQVGLVHAHFELIHPFVDGNGRIGRLLITFLLCEKSVLKRPLLYFSDYLNRNRVEYYDRLQKISRHGDWEGWLKFFLRGVALVAQEATATARRVITMREAHRGLIAEKTGRSSAKSLELLDKLYLRPVVSVNAVRQMTGLSFVSANDLVRRLCDLGLLQEITGRSRNRQFCYAPYVALFSEGQQESAKPRQQAPPEAGGERPVDE